MKKSLILSALAATLIGCNSGNNNQNQSVNQDSAAITAPTAPKSEATPQPSTSDPNVDWDKPLYTLNSETRDTIRKWIYTDSTIEIREEYTEESYGYEGDACTVFDKDGRMKSDHSSINSGNVHNSDMEYTYNGKVRTGEGMYATEGYPSFTEVKEVTYFADAECKQDTLGQTFSAEVEWDTMEDENAPDTKLELESFYVKKFTNGKVTETTNYGIDSKTGKKVFRSRIVYEYDAAGLLTKSIIVNEQGTPKGEYAETVYTYKDNTCESSNSGTGEITYYARKK